MFSFSSVYSCDTNKKRAWPRMWSWRKHSGDTCGDTAATGTKKKKKRKKVPTPGHIAGNLCSLVSTTNTTTTTTSTLTSRPTQHPASTTKAEEENWHRETNPHILCTQTHIYTCWKTEEGWRMTEGSYVTCEREGVLSKRWRVENVNKNPTNQEAKTKVWGRSIKRELWKRNV